jgi:uncharacterized membrane protein YhaH (DUF805 family)
MKPVTAARAAIVGVVLGSPAVVAFFSGGYFDRPRLWAGIAAWLAAAVAAIVCIRPWPRTRAAWLAVGGLAALTVWTIISIAWAPLRDAAQADAQRTLLYLGGVLAGIAVLRDRGMARATEPVLAFGALIVICEGLSERVFPGLFSLSHGISAAGRLTQPLTYWNAMGMVGAMAFVLFVRLAGDPSRPRLLRLAATAAGPPVALGVYLTLSRGALLAAAIGLVVLLLLVPKREQAGATVLMLIGAIPPVVAGVALSGVRTMHGTLGHREAEGLVVLGLLAASMAGSAAAMEGILRRHRSARPPAGLNPTIRRLAVAGGLAVAVATAVAFIAAATSRVEINQTQAATAATARLASTETVRGNFWSVAASAFGDHPIRGAGAGGFETEWRRQRTILYSARDAHSLYLETLTELGLVGLCALVMLIAGVAVCARRAFALDPGLSAGWIAVVSAFAVHAGLDWDWEMPAVSLFAFALVAAIVAQADATSAPARAAVAVKPAPERATVAGAVES